jgi:spore maturation protein CgeB
MTKLRILFVLPGADISIADVGRGYYRALAAMGHEMHAYSVVKRLQYHFVAMKEGGLDQADPSFIKHASLQACETIVVEALRHSVDLVIICSGLNVHPEALRLVEKVQIPVAIILTESPYEDADQHEFASFLMNPMVFTNDRASERHGWTYLGAAYDPEFHSPATPNPDLACDVLLIGTGWPERQAILEAVNWEGIHLRLIGPWPHLMPGSPLRDAHEDMVVPNKRAREYYASAKICLNLHRASDEACSLGPRAYELAACGAFQLSDPRPELFDVFGDNVPTFRTGPELEKLVRFYLAHPEARETMAARQCQAVIGHTFHERATRLMDSIAHADAFQRLAGTV